VNSSALSAAPALSFSRVPPHSRPSGLGLGREDWLKAGAGVVIGFSASLNTPPLATVSWKLLPARIILSWTSLCFRHSTSSPFTLRRTSPGCNPAASDSDSVFTFWMSKGVPKSAPPCILNPQGACSNLDNLILTT